MPPVPQGAKGLAKGQHTGSAETPKGLALERRQPPRLVQQLPRHEPAWQELIAAAITGSPPLRSASWVRW
jgi:hypothetical protein